MASRSSSLLAAVLVFGCATERAPAVVLSAPRLSAASVRVESSEAGGKAPKPTCGVDDYTPEDMYEYRPERTCEPPRYCSATYFEHEKARAKRAGPPPDAKTIAAGSCVVRTEHAFIEWVTVTPEGDAPFLVQIEDMPVTVLPGAGNESSEVAVHGLLSFYGRSRIETLGVAPGVALADGRLQTGRGTRAVPTAIQGGDARVDLLLADEVTVRGVSVPCAWLRVTKEPQKPTQFATFTRDRSGRPVRGASISLFATHDGTSALEVAIPYLLTFESVGARTRVAQNLDDGGTLRGWVTTADLLPAEEGGGGTGYGTGSGGCGCPGYDSGQGKPPVLVVVVRAGTPVWSKAGSGRWATFTKDVELWADQVGADGAEWLKLRAVPGVSERLPCDVRAFVRRSEVRVLGPAT